VRKRTSAPVPGGRKKRHYDIESLPAEAIPEKQRARTAHGGYGGEKGGLAHKMGLNEGGEKDAVCVQKKKESQ